MLYRLDACAAQIAECFGARAGQDPWAGGYIAPGKFAPVLTGGREEIAGPRPAGPRLEPRMIPRLWGVPPPPGAADTAQGGITVVRNPGSPFWIGNLRNSEFRCLVPATSFMEWHKRKTLDGKRVQGWYAASDQPVFAFAGVWKDSEVPSFALLTCEPNAVLRSAGLAAMPVILPADRETQKLWLYGDWKRASKLIAPYSSSPMTQ
ncbi:MAG: SOS response-associated peptidase [Sphingomonadaceae bacterium]|nr:SOS response-associated peptidase [Sphingomonadaceae bacterium]